MNDRTILHVDMDAFFAAVEALDNPDLRGLPVVVGGKPQSRGVVAAASYEARAFGIHSAMSSWQAHRLCPQAVFVKPRGGRYREASRRVFDIFHEFTPLVEPVSIDEAFLDVTGSRRLFGTAVSIGRTIKRRIRDEIGLTASVGVAPNKFLAKLASDLEKPDGFVIVTPKNAERILADLPVGRIWGVGPRLQETLAGLGIRKIGDLLTCPPEVLHDRLGPYADTLLDLAHGRDDRPVVVDECAKSIGAERTFESDIHGTSPLRRKLDEMVDEVARRLRRKGLRARTVTLKARFPDFTTQTRSQTLSTPTSRTLVLRRTARDLLEHRLGRAGRPLRLLGVSLSNLERSDEGQADLFDDVEERTEGQIDHIVDELQDRFGPDAIRRGE